MGQGPIPEPVRKFVLAHVSSVEQLEVLLHLRMYPDREWTADAVSQALRTNPLSAAGRLKDLESRRFISRRKEQDAVYYRYAPAPEVKPVVDGLASFYRSHSTRIIELIYSRPAEAIRYFADAFRIRRDDDK